jgi:hypothetical protein
MDYLQMWWEEKYPKAGVRKIANVSEGIITLEDLQDFEKWLVKNSDLYRISNCSCISRDTLTPEARKMFDDIDKALERKK